MTKHFTLTTVILGISLMPSPGAAQTTTHLDWDATAAATYLDDRQEWWMHWEPAQRERGTFCISCHTAVPYALSRSALRVVSDETAPVPQENALLENVRRRGKLWEDVAPERIESKGSEAILNSLVLASHDAQEARLNSDTRLAFEHLWKMQLEHGKQTGAWPWLHANLEPWEEDGGPYYGAALAALAIGTAPEGYAHEPANTDRLSRLTHYLTEHHNKQNLFNQLTALWASSRLPNLLEPAFKVATIERTFSRQRADGGWSLSSLGPYQLREGSPRVAESDGYATGMIAFVLLQTGIESTHPGLSHALTWLSENQDTANGSWPAQSLNKHRDPSSNIGRFMRDAATAYAVLALTSEHQETR